MNIDQVLIDATGRLQPPAGTSLPGTPTEGDVFFKSDEYKMYVYAKGVWTQQIDVHDPGAIFGIDAQYQEAEGPFSKATIGWSTPTGATLTWTPPIAGDYMVHISCEISNSGVNSSTSVLFELDNGGLIAGGVEFLHCGHEPELTGQYMSVSACKKFTLTAASHRIDVSYSGDGGTRYIRYIRIVSWRVS